MTIQDEILCWVEQHGGVDDYIINLERVRVMFSPDKRFHIDEMIIYIRILHRIDVDVYADFQILGDRAHQATMEFDRIHRITGDVFCFDVANFHRSILKRTRYLRVVS